MNIKNFFVKFFFKIIIISDDNVNFGELCFGIC